MTRTPFAGGLCAAFVVLGFAAAHAASDPAASGPQGDTWDSIKQLPDFSGAWQPTTQGAGGGTGLVEPMPLTPAWQKKVLEEQRIHNAGGDVEGRAKYCVELGFPGGLSGPTTLAEYIFVPGRVLITNPTGYTRRIYMDGRKHHVGPPTLNGDSIGHWEGQTLVIDTVNLHFGNEYIYGLPIGHDAHTVERYTLTGPDTMQLDMMLEGKEAFAEPYKWVVKYRRRAGVTPTEDDCAQNNRDLNGEGKQIMDLTPPPEGPSTAPHFPNSGPGSWKNRVVGGD
jgi:hypothetical protein